MGGSPQAGEAETEHGHEDPEGHRRVGPHRGGDDSDDDLHGERAQQLAPHVSRSRSPTKEVHAQDVDELGAAPADGSVVGEQEGFGIVFLEAAAAGVAQLAGRSGGSHEAVVDGVTGLVVDDAPQAASALRRLISDPDLRGRLGAAARERVVQELTYDVLALRLAEAIDNALRGRTE